MDIVRVVIATLGIIGGLLVGSGLAGPFQWIVELGLPSNSHFAVGTLLSVISVAVHLLLGGGLNPFNNSEGA